MTLESLTHRVAGGETLDAGAIACSVEELFNPTRSIEDRAAFLSALHHRGETPEEVAGFVEVLLARAVPCPVSGAGAIDVCGTGGDRSGWFNVSTTVMFVVAGCGLPVVKHGNRGITSASGGADVLSSLGVDIQMPPEHAAERLAACGCCFLFAPLYHPTFAAVAPVRKALAERGETSIFNMLGPLLNPARPDFQLAGVFDPALLTTYGKVFSLLGRKKAWAVHGIGPDGARYDEVSPVGPTEVVACGEDASPRAFTLQVEEAGIPAVDISQLRGGDAAQNAQIITGILDGSITHSARHVVQLNAAAALWVAGRAESLADGWRLTSHALDSGAAWNALQGLRS